MLYDSAPMERLGLTSATAGWETRESGVKRTGRVALVTGGAGFIGSHLCDRLIGEGARVVALDNFQTGRRENIAHLLGHDRFSLIEHDVIDELPRSLRTADLTHIYHLASAASPPHYQADPEHTMLTNVVGTRNALRLGRADPGSAAADLDQRGLWRPGSSSPARRLSGSGQLHWSARLLRRGQAGAETLAFDFLRAGRADVRVARIFNTYGPRMRCDDGRVVSNVICQALGGADITIYGEGTQTRCFGYVDDTVEGLLRLMDSNSAAGLPVNLGDPRELTVRELVVLVISLTATSPSIVEEPLPQDDPRRRKPDIGRAIELLDWRPAVALEDGLTATIAWFREELRTQRVEAEPAIAAE